MHYCKNNALITILPTSLNFFIKIFIVAYRNTSSSTNGARITIDIIAIGEIDAAATILDVFSDCVEIWNKLLSKNYQLSVQGKLKQFQLESIHMRFLII